MFLSSLPLSLFHSFCVLLSSWFPPSSSALLCFVELASVIAIFPLILILWEKLSKLVKCLTLTSPRCPKLMNSVNILWWLVSSRHVAVETHWISTAVQITQFFPCFQGLSLLSFVFLFFHFPFFIFFSFYWCVVRSENTISLSLGHSSIIQVDLIVSMEKLNSTLGIIVKWEIIVLGHSEVLKHNPGSQGQINSWFRPMWGIHDSQISYKFDKPFDHKRVVISAHRTILHSHWRLFASQLINAGF